MFSVHRGDVLQANSYHRVILHLDLARPSRLDPKVFPQCRNVLVGQQPTGNLDQIAVRQACDVPDADRPCLRYRSADGRVTLPARDRPMVRIRASAGQLFPVSVGGDRGFPGDDRTREAFLLRAHGADADRCSRRSNPTDWDRAADELSLEPRRVETTRRPGGRRPRAPVRLRRGGSPSTCRS